MGVSAAAVQQLADEPQRQHSLRGEEGHDERPATAQGRHALAAPSTLASLNT